MACAVAACLVGTASGAQGGQFGLAAFAMQTTRAVPAPGVPGPGFRQEPYAFTQAGGHPEALTTRIEFDSEEVGENNTLVPTGDPKDFAITLPAGFLASPAAASACPGTQVLAGEACPADTQVGVYTITALKGKVLFGPVIEVTAEAGQSVGLVLETQLKVPLVMSGRLVRTSAGYALAVVASGLPAVGVLSVEVTLWGVPAAESHEPERGLLCESRAMSEWTCEGGGEKSGISPVPFLTTGSDCAAGPQSASVSADSWEEPGRWISAQATLPAILSGPPAGLEGCGMLSFSPSLAVSPETTLADEPVGLSVTVESPQTESVQGTGTPPLRDATVALPADLSLNPAGVDGLVACPASGPEGFDMPSGLNGASQAFTPGEVGEGEELGPDELKRLAPGYCPEASAVGKAEAVSPLLSRALQGRVYIAQPGCGGSGQAACTERNALDGSLYRVYVELGGVAEGEASAGVAQAPVVGTGVVVKLEGAIDANPATGQLTVRIENAPQLPLSRLTLRLKGGPRALLANPSGCGRATTTADFTPWSAPGTTPEGVFVAGTPDATSSSSYEVSGCSSPPGLSPGLTAGTVSSLGGAFSPFTLTVTREDREQYLQGLQVKLPAGLLGMLGGVPPCGEAAAREGECPASSRIGGSIVAAGAGSHPFEMAGNVYLTGPYGGPTHPAPYGLAIVTDAIAGPFHLGRVTIRARIDIDPDTGALTITSDPLPRILLGIPLRLRRFTLNLDRPNFMFNPTDCSAKRIEAVVAGAQGAAASVGSPFALGGCKGLAFKPALAAATSGRASATGSGASLDLRVAFPQAKPAASVVGGKAGATGSEANGGEANLAKVKIALPRALAPRLTTLQGACEDTVFEADAAACPASSVVGIVRASTPVLAGGMAGPVYFVSHEGRAFPSLVAVLQGSGVRLDLTGSTEIERSGATSVAFRQIPDVPVSSFEVYLSQGRHSALGAASSLCALSRIVTVKRKVTRRSHGRPVRRTVKVRKRVPHSALIPTALVAQNGLVRHEGTVLSVAGCGKRHRRYLRSPPRE